MRDSNPPPDLLRRANRIGLRTLRQRPQAVGQTRDGEHLFEVRSVRLLLGSTSNHFSLSVPCSECGRDVAGPAVLNRTDLDISVSPAICPDCAERARASAAGSTSPLRAPAPVRAPVNSDRGDFSGVGWMDVVNQPLEPAMTRPPAKVVGTTVAAPAPEPGVEPPIEPARAELHEGLAEARAAVKSLSESTAARLAAMEAQLRLRLTGLAAEVDAHGTDLAGLAESGGASRAALQQVMVSQQELIRSKDETKRQLAELAGITPPELDTTAVDDLQKRLEDMRSEVAKAMGAQRHAVAELAESAAAERNASQAQLAKARNEIAHLQETLGEALIESRREAAVRERELKVAVSDLRALVAALRSDLGTSTQAHLDRLAAQVERHGALAASVESLAAAVQVGERRTSYLEHRVEDAVSLLSERLDDQREELAQAIERELLRFELGLRPGAVQAPAGPEGTGNGQPPNSLLNSLDDELRAVEIRLAKLAANDPA